MDQETNGEIALKRKVSSRKFIFSVGVALSSSGLVGFGLIDAASYAQIINVTILAYMTGNVAQNVMTKR